MSEMSMVERVARAIAQADEQNGGPPYDYLMAMGKHVRENLYDRALAAIAAMRVPTEEMELAGDDHAERGAVVWQAMISAALKEKSA
jgi:predicted RNA-binding Zn ribbon-like protein